MSTAIEPRVHSFISESAIASWLGFDAEIIDGAALYHLAFQEEHIGNPAIRALHGGVVAAFLEFAAQCELLRELGGGDIRTVNTDVSYIASTRAQNMAGAASVLRTGRRIAFVEATAWQESRERPVAKGTFRIRIGATD
ncbi:MAG: PaaI family thioesterase [Hyphococcus sp.]